MKNHRVSRRELLLGAGLLATASATLPVAAARPAQRVAGVQLYTLRESMATDVAGTLRAVAGIGYRDVEFAGYFDVEPRHLRRWLDDFGLDAPSTHVDARALRADPGPLIEAALDVGHRYLTIGWLRPEDRETLDDYRAWAEHCNRAGEACRKHGLRLAWHNHDFELLPLDGGVPYDVLLARTEPQLVDFQLDFFWARKAGRDIQRLLGSAPNRFTMAHIKDMDDDGNMVDVGAGTIDFARILQSSEAAGLRHLFVEHDQPADPFKSVAISHYALRTML